MAPPVFGQLGDARVSAIRASCSHQQLIVPLFQTISNSLLAWQNRANSFKYNRIINTDKLYRALSFQCSTLPE